MRPAWAEVDLGAIAKNVEAIKRFVGTRVAVMAVVKANAYGHGILEVSRTALRHGASWLGVALKEEASYLRQQGVKVPILILGTTPPEQAGEVVRANVSQTVYSYSQGLAFAQAAAKQGKKAKLHFKIDTGMGRLGFLPSAEAREAILALCRLPSVEAEGIFTHFAAAESDQTFTRLQLQRFQQFKEELERKGAFFPWVHAANSAALLNFPESRFCLVRPGITIYGHYPAPWLAEKIRLFPAMSLKARVASVKEFGPGESISYGRTYFTKGRTTVAVIPLGYADGYSRLLSNRGEVLIRGEQAPVIGTVCMDQFMVDVSHVPGVQLGEKVTIFGRDGEKELPVEELAAKIGTVNYEVLCAVSARVPRVYRGEEI